MSFNKNVFINCPFDNDYFPILRSIIFAGIYLGFEIKISETSDSGEARITKIRRLIRQSKFSIHDLSRIELNENYLPRFNMPFECGIDFGSKYFGSKQLKSKKFLILDKERYRYQQFISDIAGNDIRSHENSPELAIKAIRDWMNLNSSKRLQSSKGIWLLFNEFISDYNQIAEAEEFNPNDIAEINFSDYIDIVKQWIKNKV